ncbi:MAG: hypothetical protein HUJ29_03950 [Gammaproteobacteria bacterium]|nr:hypothetical protein [Gammaproteobacteria bacterium]
MTESKQEQTAQAKDSPLKHKVKTKAADKKAEKKAKLRKPRRWPVFFTFLIAVAGVGASYYLWQEFQVLSRSVFFLGSSRDARGSYRDTGWPHHPAGAIPARHAG